MRYRLTLLASALFVGALVSSLEACSADDAPPTVPGDGGTPFDASMAKPPDGVDDASSAAADGATSNPVTADGGADGSALGLFIQSAYPAPPLPYGASEPDAATFSADARVAAAADLHARLLRTAVRFLGDAGTEGLPFAEAILDGGFELGLTVLSQPPNESGATDAIPDSGLAAYHDNLDALLSTMHPAILMVENEEIAPNFYSGTAATYASELAVAVAVGHAHSIPVTNGGLTSVPCRLVTWQSLFTSGQVAAADSFAAATLAPGLRNELPSAANPDAGVTGTSLQILTTAAAYLAAYRSSTMDFVNIHIYELDRASMEQIVAAISAAVPGKRVMTGEMGQYDEDAATVATMLGVATDQRFPFVIWFSGDGNPAVGLLNSTSGPPGYSVRTSGDAYRAAAIASGQ